MIFFLISKDLIIPEQGKSSQIHHKDNKPSLKNVKLEVIIVMHYFSMFSDLQGHVLGTQILQPPIG